MRAAAFVLIIILCAHPSAPAGAAACSDDYATIETIRGTIMEIRPSPEPFRSADIYFAGPAPCTRIWMQVLKGDAGKCRIGGPIMVKGIVTQDVENSSWEIGSGKNEYMTLGDDFTCG